MTSGAAIAHAERTPARNSGRLNGAQLWVALPDRAARRDRAGVCGSLSALPSPSTHHSGIFGGDVQVHPGATLEVPLDRALGSASALYSGPRLVAPSLITFANPNPAS